MTGQIEGGTAQGIGLALMEEIQTRDGRITNASFTDYLLPTALDMPPVESVLIEDPEPDAPYGVKGVGEPPTVVSTAAVVAAMRAATGRPLRRVPVRPDEICRAGRPASAVTGSRLASGGITSAGRRGTSRRITTATEVRITAAPTAICHVTTSSRKRTPSVIATSGFTYA